MLLRNILPLLSSSFDHRCTVELMQITSDIAHPLKRKVVSVPDSDQQRSRNGVLQPTVLVCFHSQAIRDSIIRE